MDLVNDHLHTLIDLGVEGRHSELVGGRTGGQMDAEGTRCDDVIDVTDVTF